MASGCHFFSIPIPPLRPNRRCRCLCASQSPPPPSSAISLVAPSLPKTLSEIYKNCVIACLRAKDGMLAMEAARAALKGGISLLEVTMSTPDALMVIQGLMQENPSSIVGEILHEVEGSGVLYIPGVMTPTEVLCAYEAGAKLVKVYPASILGGSKYISALKRPFPHIPMVASQGISIDSLKQYIDAGTSAVILSDAIFDKNAMKQRDFDSISRLAGLAVSKVAQAGT